RLWAVVRHHLHAYQSQYGDDVSARCINALLNGEPFPGKANLINRFFKRPDRASGYLPVNNPLGTLGGNPAWS
ncbi:MAG TPA: IucA/IucC family C-terminal-domain containing protein, partial [Thiobacillus sp.]|nr:IucA/IucC family C-terminal-domain containing protein [Thiobacillus sp.]